MKKLLAILLLSIICLKSSAQTDPTLAVGLETLTYGKGTIDVELLTEIIMEKQKELKQEALKRFMFNLFPEGNYTTKFYMQNALHILLNEQNPEVIKKELMELLTNYSLALGFTIAYEKINPKLLHSFNSLFDHNLLETGKGLYNESRKSKFKIRINNKIDSIEKNLIYTSTNHIDRYLVFKQELLKLFKNINSLHDYDIKKVDSVFIKIYSDDILELEEFSNNKNKISLIKIVNYIDNNNIKKNSFKTPIEKLVLEAKLYKKITKYIGNNDKNSINELLRSKEEILIFFKNTSKLVKNRKKNNRLLRKSDRLKRKAFRNDINLMGDELNLDTRDVPFDILLDIIATVLSENKYLQKKGFFKQKIDFHKTDWYAKLKKQGNYNINLKQIIKLKDKINFTIEDLVNNYNTIKELSKQFENINENSQDVFSEIRDIYEAIFDESLKHLFIKDGVLYFSENVADSFVNEKKAIETLTNEISSLESQLNNAKNIIYELRLQKDEVNQNTNKQLIKIDQNISNSLTKIKKEIALNYTKTKASDPIKKDETHTLSNDSPPSLINNNTIKLTDTELNKIDNLQNKNSIDSTKSLENNIKEINQKIANIQTNIITKGNILNDIQEKINKDDVQLQEIIKKGFEKGILNELEEKLSEIRLDINDFDSLSVNKIRGLIKNIFIKTKALANKEKIVIKDINEFNEFIADLLEIRIFLKDNADKSHTKITEIKTIIEDYLIPFLYNKAIGQIQSKLSKNQAKLVIEFLGFLSNLDNLDKAETFDHVINLFREGNDEINKHLKDGEFKNLYNLFSNAIKKYTLVNSKEQYIEVDVASFLVELEGYYDKNNTAHWGFYLGIGLSQNFFLRNVPLSENEEASRTVGFASEKLGVKYKILDFKRASDYTNVVPNDIYLSNRSPFINEWYANLYGSGLLYTLANSTTKENFDFAHVGLGTGIRFYNALDFSVNIGFPMGENSKPFKDAFVGFGFDIPLSEYLSRSKTKRAKSKKD